MKKMLISVAWPYANAPIHEGHPPGYLIPADIFARYHRLRGNDVLMVSGTDAHGTPNTIAAEIAGMDTQDFVDNVHKVDIDYWDKLGISYDYYTKTSNETHKREFIKLFLEIYKNGFITQKKVKYFYSKKERKALLDRHLEGTCPYCDFDKARGDQCDNCGKTLTPFELINPKSIYGDENLEVKETTDLFLDLAKLQPDLEKWLKDKTYWRKHVSNFVDAWIKEGLHARAITRDIDWGIKIPDEIDLEGKENKRFYVWVEAVAGYLTASINWSLIKDGQQEAYEDDYICEFNHESTDWKDWWFNKESKHYYFMGKDNIPFHAIIWPSMLIAANKSHKVDEQYQLPYDVPANNYMNLQGQKISKSRNWMIGLDHLLDNYDINLIRYYFTSRMPENKDSDFRWEDFVGANNNELVATVGNFIHRTVVFIEKNFESKVPNGKLNDEVEKEIEKAFENSSKAFESVKLVEGLNEIMKLAHFGNKYFNDTRVWEVIKDDKEKAGEILYNCIEIILALRILLYPIMPDFSDNLSRMLNIKKVTPTVNEDIWSKGHAFVPRKGKACLTPTGIKINKPSPMFAKIDEQVIAEEEAKLG